MRILGIDYGDARVGVAVSDPMGWMATELPQLKGGDMEEVCGEIGKIVKEYGVEKIVLGYPKNMNGTIGPRGELSEQFKEILEKNLGLPVVLWDERLTTVSADRVMMESGVRREDRKQFVDKIAATIILQGYLDRKKFEAQNK